MTDEKFLFLQDLREKGNIGRSATHKRTHTGRGGKVKFPSDYLTRKELAAMNGECRTYRLNDPMTWDEFKSMPDELKISYINAIRERYRLPDSKIFADLFGKSQTVAKRTIGDLGIGRGRGHQCTHQDIHGWNKWLNRDVPTPEETEQTEDDPVEADEPEIVEAVPVAEEIAEEPVMQQKEHGLTPYSGTIMFEGAADKALEAVKVLLNGGNVRLTVHWESLNEKGRCEAGE